MNLEGKKQTILASLEQLRIRIQQLQAELAQRQMQEQQVIGALMLVDELLASEEGARVQPDPEPIP